MLTPPTEHLIIQVINKHLMIQHIVWFLIFIFHQPYFLALYFILFVRRNIKTLKYDQALPL